MITTIIFSGLLLVGQAEESQDADGRQLELQVRRLVRQLDDDELARRVEAEQELTALGPAALEFLPRITSSTSAEVKERLGRVRKTLEELAVKENTKATTVTLQGETTLAEAIAALEAQTGNRVAGMRSRDQQVTTDFSNTPYWQALDSLLDQAQLTLNPFGGELNALNLAARPDEQLPRVGRAAYGEIFRFEPARVQAVRDLRNPAISGLTLALDIWWEPRIRPISLELPLEELSATDESGAALAISGEQRLEGLPQSGATSMELELPLSLPGRNTTKIASLKGKLIAVLPGRMETFEFADLSAKGDVQERAGVTVTLDQVRKNVDLYEVRIRLRYDEAANALESHQSWVDDNDRYLVGPGGEQIDEVAFNFNLQRSNEVGMSILYSLAEPLEKYTFVYKTPAAIVKKPVEFELKDIPLP